MSDKRDESYFSKMASYLPTSITALTGPAIVPRRRMVVWKHFELYPYRDQAPHRLLVLGLMDGIVVYRIYSSLDIRKVASISEPHTPISCVRMLWHHANTVVPEPNDSSAAVASASASASATAMAGTALPARAANLSVGPLLVVASAEDRVSFARTCVKVYSLNAKKWVHMLRFRSRVHTIATSAHHLLVALDTELHVFRVHTSGGGGGSGAAPKLQFDVLFITKCYPNPECHAVFALGPRWLAYAGNEPVRHAPPLSSPSLSPSLHPSVHHAGAAGGLPSLSLAPAALSSSPGLRPMHLIGGSGSGSGAGSASSASSAASSSTAVASAASSGGGNSIGSSLSFPSTEAISDAAKSMASNLYTVAGIGKQKLASYLNGEPAVDASELGIAAAGASGSGASSGANGSGSGGSPNRVPASPYSGTVIVRDLISKRVITHFQSDTRVAPMWNAPTHAPTSSVSASVSGVSGGTPPTSAATLSTAAASAGAPLGWLAFDPTGTLLVTVPVDGQYLSIYQVVAVPALNGHVTSITGAAPPPVSASGSASSAAASAASAARDIPRKNSIPAATPSPYQPSSSPPASSSLAVPGASGNNSSGNPPIGWTTRLLYSIFRGITHASIRNVSFSHDSQWLIVNSERTTHIFALHLYGTSGGAVAGGVPTALTHGPPSLVALYSRGGNTTSEYGGTAITPARSSSTPVQLSAIHRIQHPVSTHLLPHSAWYTPIIGTFHRSSADPDALDDLYILTEGDRLVLYNLRVPMPTGPVPGSPPPAASGSTPPTAAAAASSSLYGTSPGSIAAAILASASGALSSATSSVASSSADASAPALALEVTERCSWDLSSVSAAPPTIDNEAVGGSLVEPFFEQLQALELSIAAAAAGAPPQVSGASPPPTPTHPSARLTPSPSPSSTPTKPVRPNASGAMDSKHSVRTAPAAPVSPTKPMTRFAVKPLLLDAKSSDDGVAAGGAAANDAIEAIQSRWMSHAELRTYRTATVPIWATPQFTLKTYTTSNGGSAVSGSAAAILQNAADPNYVFAEEWKSTDLVYDKFTRFDGLSAAAGGSAAPAGSGRRPAAGAPSGFSGSSAAAMDSALEETMSDALDHNMEFSVSVASPSGSSPQKVARVGSGGAGVAAAIPINLTSFVAADTFYRPPAKQAAKPAAAATNNKKPAAAAAAPVAVKPVAAAPPPVPVQVLTAAPVRAPVASVVFDDGDDQQSSVILSHHSDASVGAGAGLSGLILPGDGDHFQSPAPVAAGSSSVTATIAIPSAVAADKKVDRSSPSPQPSPSPPQPQHIGTSSLSGSGSGGSAGFASGGDSEKEIEHSPPTASVTLPDPAPIATAVTAKPAAASKSKKKKHRK